jgi:hypothetical protein
MRGGKALHHIGIIGNFATESRSGVRWAIK